jgi:ADP-ribose pyrophosphatase YjhB (NUDIX family)
MEAKQLLEDVKRMKVLADLGLLYHTNEYDRDRYQELQEISYRMLSMLSGHSLEELKVSLPLAQEYPTAKVDLRGLLLSQDNKILLVREGSDGRWAMPGGWADIGFSPAEGITKEFKEETGLDVVPLRLLALIDKKMHPHPTEQFYIYKLVFLCKAVSGQLLKGFDVLDVAYFSIDELPELSEDRNLKSQIELVYQKALSGDRDVYFD